MVRLEAFGRDLARSRAIMTRMRLRLPFLAGCTVLALMLLAACGGGSNAPATPPASSPTAPASLSATTTAPAGSMTLTSAAFAAGASIPADFTCDGQGASPPLAWTGVPATAKALALIVDDPDASASGFVHWVVYALPPEMTSFAATISPKPAVLPGGLIEGVNGAGKLGYTGPCPPAGQQHHYNFHLYALDAALVLPPGKTRAEVESAMAGHTIAQATLTGLYQRR